jgi:hypothetical protein
MSTSGGRSVGIFRLRTKGHRVCLYMQLVSVHWCMLHDCPQSTETFQIYWRMPSYGMLLSVALVITDVSEERITFIIRVTRIGELGTTLAVTSNRHTLHTSKYIVTYTTAVWCVVLWLITLRGFGLDTGFIHYGDYNYTNYNYCENISTWSFLNLADGAAPPWRLTSRAEHFWFRRLTDDDSRTHWRRLISLCLPLTTSGCPNGNTGLTTVGYHSNQHWPSHYWLLCS